MLQKNNNHINEFDTRTTILIYTNLNELESHTSLKISNSLNSNKN